MRKAIIFVAHLFTPNFWRWLLLGKTKVRIYLDNGEHLDFLCQTFNWNFNGKNCSWKATGLTRVVQINPQKIVAVKEL